MELMRATLEMFRPPRTQTVSEWADAHRVLVSESSSEPGPWRTDRAPYQREIMDAFTQPGVQEIVIKASAQVGKSEIELNMMGRAIDADPGPILYIQPTDAVAEDYSKRRIAPMIEACQVLRGKVYSARSRDASNTITMKSFPGGSLAIIGANSPSELASKPVRYIFMDEIDRFPASAGTEGDPIALAERRTETFRHNRKIVKTSTPTIKGASKIERAYMLGTQEEWHTQCPGCGIFSYIRFDDILFEHEAYKDESGETRYTVRGARWRCPQCKRETPEHEAKRLPAKWVVKNARAMENGVRSFCLNAFMSPWSDWNSIALSFLKAKDDPDLLKVFHNTMLGEVWEMKQGSGEPERLYARREHYNAQVPTGVLVLTMGIDTQDNRLEYEVVGWSREEESWGIERGMIPGRPDSDGVWAEVDALLDREWQMKSGARMRVLATFIDSGGHFTEEIYRRCAKRASRRIFPIKGDGGEGKPYVQPMKKAAGRAVGFIIGVDSGKERIMYYAGIEKPGKGYMHFPEDYRCGYDQEYFRGLLSEKLAVARRAGQSVMRWEKIYERNEPLDCRNYAQAAYRYFHWKFDELERALRGETEEAPVTRAQAERKKPRRVISRGITV
ncbi:MAG: phage terminase large subunit family protein [Candidatus Ventricola sp.]